MHHTANTLTAAQKSAIIADLSNGYEHGLGMDKAHLEEIVSSENLSTSQGRQSLCNTVYRMRGVSMQTYLTRLIH